MNRNDLISLYETLSNNFQRENNVNKRVVLCVKIQNL